MRNWESRVKQADGQCQHWHFTNSWTQNLSPLVIFPAHTAKQLSCVKKYKKTQITFISQEMMFNHQNQQKILCIKPETLLITIMKVAKHYHYAFDHQGKKVT